jgi:cytidylate kinase
MTSSSTRPARITSGRALKQNLVAGVAMGVLIALLPAAGHAQSINKLEQQIQALQTNYQAQIDNLQAQIRALKEQQAQQDVKTEAVRQQAVQVATVEKKRPHVVQTKNNRFGLESADGKNSI